MTTKAIFKFVILMLLISSCVSNKSIEKRKYRKGYYTHAYKLPKSTTKSECEKSKLVITPKKKEIAKANGDLNYPLLEESLKSEVINDYQLNASASTENIIFPLKKQNFKFFPDSGGNTIILKSDTKIIAKIIEIANEDIKYKRCDDSDSPIWKMAESVVLNISFLNKQKNLSTKKRSKLDIKEPKKKDAKTLDDMQSKNARNMAIAAIISFFTIIGIPLVLIFCPAALVYGSKVKNRGTATKEEMKRATFGIIIGMAFFIGCAIFVGILSFIFSPLLLLISLALIGIALLIRFKA